MSEKLPERMSIPRLFIRRARHEEKKEVGQVIISTEELSRYFGQEVTPRQMKEQIIALLDEWKEKQPPEKKAELEK